MANPSADLHLTVTGMTCPHCEARVEKALLARPGVSHAKADHQHNACAVTFDPSTISAEELAKTVRDAGYAASL